MIGMVSDGILNHGNSQEFLCSPKYQKERRAPKS
jgi:hypothetical protein